MSLHTRGDAVERRNAPRCRSSGTLRASLDFVFYYGAVGGTDFSSPEEPPKVAAAAGEETPQEPTRLVNQFKVHRGERPRICVGAAPSRDAVSTYT